jgi:hypothetical protein
LKILLIPLSGAELDQAVASLTQMCFDKSLGWRGTTINSNGVSSQTIIISGSNMTISKSTAIDLKKKSQRIILVEIDGKVENGDYLASSPSKSNKFHLEKFGDLENVVDVVVQAQCEVDLWPEQCYFNDGRGYCQALVSNRRS